MQLSEDSSSDLFGFFCGKELGRPVCHDYGNNALHRLAKKPAAAMQSVVWEHHV